MSTGMADFLTEAECSSFLVKMTDNFSFSNGAKCALLLPVSTGIVTLLKSRSIRYTFEKQSKTRLEICWKRLTPVMPEVVCSAAHVWVKGLREIHVYSGSAHKWQPAVADSKHITVVCS